VVTEKLSGKKVVAITANKHKVAYRKLALGTASATLKPGTQKQVSVSLNATGKKLLASRHTLKVGLSVTRKGASTITRKVTFKVPPKKKRK
jgi:hypothetical protein